LNPLTPKPALNSLTIQSGILTSVSGVVTTVFLFTSSPENMGRAATCLNAFGLTGTADAVLKFSAALPMILGLVTVFGRIKAKRTVYTAPGFPGSNPPQRIR
jgi:hypothetical protein